MPTAPMASPMLECREHPMRQLLAITLHDLSVAENGAFDDHEEREVTLLFEAYRPRPGAPVASVSRSITLPRRSRVVYGKYLRDQGENPYAETLYYDWFKEDTEVTITAVTSLASDGIGNLLLQILGSVVAGALTGPGALVAGPIIDLLVEKVGDDSPRLRILGSGVTRLGGIAEGTAEDVKISLTASEGTLINRRHIPPRTIGEPDRWEEIRLAAGQQTATLTIGVARDPDELPSLLARTAEFEGVRS